MGPIETSNSNPRGAVLIAKNNRLGLGPIETSISCPKVADLKAKTTDEGWVP